MLILAAAGFALGAASCENGGTPEVSETETVEEETGSTDPAPGVPVHLVVFNTAGGNYMAPRKIEEGKKVTSLAPKREGYSFEGWYTTSGEQYDFSTPVTSDLMLVAYWRRTAPFTASNTASPVFTTSSAAVNVVWHDNDNAAGARPDSVRCVFTTDFSGRTGTYYVKVTSAGAAWDGDAAPEGTLSRGEGNWTAKITGLRASGSYTFAAEQPESGYSLLQSGTSAIMTASGYRAITDGTAALTATNGRLYDLAGNVVVLRGLVTLIPGNANYPTLVSAKALERMAKKGVNCLRITLQLTSDKAGGPGYISNAGVPTAAERRAELEELVRSAVTTASSLGMYTIIDWGILNENPNVRYDEAADFFRRAAEEYKSNPRVIFEICNEPNDTWGTKNGEEHSIKRYEEKIIEVIRETGAENIVICSPNANATGLSVYGSTPVANDDPIDDPIENRLAWNVAYTFHCYPYNYPWDEKEVTSYGWKLRDAVEAGLTVITTEMSPIKANLTNGKDETKYDLGEMAKFLNFYLENDLGFCYFRYNFSSDSAPLSQWIMFRPGVSPQYSWDRDDLTDCGQWFYDVLTSDGVIRAADFSVPRHTVPNQN